MSEKEPNQPKDLQGLLKFCLEQTAAEDAPASTAKEMDPEKKQFLEKVLNATQSFDPVKELKKAMDLLVSKVDEVSSMDSSNASHSTLLEEIDNIVDCGIIDLIGSADFANDFFKMGGVDVINKCLACPVPEVQVKGFDILAEAVQNNPYAQSVVLDTDLLRRMTGILDDSSKEEVVRTKALYAISCLIRENAMAADQFQTGSGGFSVLLKCIQSRTPSNKLRIKGAFVISSLCQSSTSIQESLFRLGLLNKLVEVLKQEHDSSHEHIASALRSLISGNEKAKQAVTQGNLGLEDLLRNRMKELSDREEFQDEIVIYKDILDICSNPVEASNSSKETQIMLSENN